MEYEIFGGHLPAVTIKLDQGEQIQTQSGGLAWMSENIEMDTNMKGGFFGAIGRLFSGESLFIATYTSRGLGQEITLSSDMPGEIRAFELDGAHGYVAQKGAFLGSTTDVEIEAYVNNSFSAGLFGGEGFVLQHYSGNGTIWVELDGAIKEIELARGEKVIVSSSHVAVFEDSVGYEVRTVKGFKNILFGGEGLFLTELTGPGKVYLQTMTVADLASRLIPFMPTPSSTSSSSN